MSIEEKIEYPAESMVDTNNWRINSRQNRRMFCIVNYVHERNFRKRKDIDNFYAWNKIINKVGNWIYVEPMILVVLVARIVSRLIRKSKMQISINQDPKMRYRKSV